MRLTDDEYKRLSECQSAEDWNAAVDAVKATRGGEYPTDWFARVIRDGLIRRLGISALLVVHAWQDTPTCPACWGPLVLREECGRASDYDPVCSLVCVLCGRGHAGDAAELAQARSARDAWEAHVKAK